MVDKISGNPKVFEEAREEHARGGKVEHHKKKKKHHGKHHREHGGEVEGEMARHRMDRPRRARGGACSDQNPMSSAHRTHREAKKAD